MTDTQVEQIIRILKAMGYEVKRISAELPFKELAREIKASKRKGVASER